MELQQLKYFEVVAKYENMSKAAAELRIAQPAVSQSIARLEEELNIKLFDRKGKRIYLNKQGQYLLKKLPSMLEPFDSMKSELADIANRPIQHIRILVQSSSVLMPELLMSFKKKHPQAKFTLAQNEHNNQYDICITSASYEKFDGVGKVVLEEEIYLAVPTSSLLARQKDIHLGELEEEDFISLGQDGIIRKITDYYCVKAGINPKIVFESDNPGTVRGLIEVGLGIAFYPQITWGPLTSPNATLRSISDITCRRYIVIQLPQGKYASKIVQEFYEHAISYYGAIGLIRKANSI